MSFRIDYEIESHHAILVDPTNQCEISCDEFGTEVAKPDHIEIVHEGKEQNEIIPLQAHDKAKQTRKDSFKCKTCDKTFTQRGSLKIHIAAVHDGKKPYKCEICTLTFALKHNLIQHMTRTNVHKTIREMKSTCEICYKKCWSKKRLENHTLTHHEGNKPVHCNGCNIPFTTKQIENIQLVKVHEGSNKISCEFCDATFEFECHLKSHFAAVHDGKKPYKCDVCKTSFSTKESKNRHMASPNVHKTIKEMKSSKCDICDKTFISKNQLKNHIAMDHKGKEPFLCDICNITFATKHNKNMHLVRVHNVVVSKEKNCENCDASFQFQHQLVSHMAKAHGEKHIESHQCIICDKVLTSKVNLKKNIASVHDGKKPYKCDICNSKFATNGNKKKHMASPNVHKTIKEMKSSKCEFCDKPFPSNAQLKNHIDVDHKGKEPFLCDICNITFATKQNKNMHLLRVHYMIVSREIDCKNCDASFEFKHQLESHMAKAHIEALRYKICNQIFKSTVTLKTHVAVVHDGKKTNPEGEKPFPCDICNFTLATKQSKKRHLTDVHGEMFEQKVKDTKCEICEANFKFPFQLKIHIANVHEEKKAYECNLCDSSFGLQSSLYNHIGSVHAGIKNERIFNCESCDKIYTQKSHLKRHIAEIHESKFPFKCHICAAKFTQSSELEEHLQIHEGEQPFQCHMCNAKFVSSKDLVKHVSAVHFETENFKVKQFTCEICFISFKHNLDFEEHMIAHDGLEPFRCDICESRCISEQDLKSHYSAIHISLTKKVGFEFEFEFDASNFKTDKGSLLKEEAKEVHEKIGFDTKSEASTDSLHGFQKAYVNLDFNVHEEREELGPEKSCESDSYNQKNNSKVHIVSVATEKKPFRCHICNIAFSKKHSKKRHLANVHGEIFEQKYKNTKCEICEANFKFPFQLKIHIANVHEEKRLYVCELCDSSFGLQSSLLNHKKTHASIKNEEIFNCDRCGKIYTQKCHLKSHIAELHDGNRPFQCKICDIKFPRKNNLTYHIALTHQELNCDI